MAGTKLAPDLTAADPSEQPDLTTSENNGLPTDSPLLRSIPLEAIPPVSGGKLFLQPLLNLHEIKALEALYRKLPDYFSADDKLTILRAYLVASDAHREQTRMTGEPYILHPIDVTNILAELQLDADTLAAGLLHDVVEDSVYTIDYLNKNFNREIAELVDGVTKLNRIKELSNMRHSVADEKAESLRKMFLAMVEDIRVVLIKLADRVHNMRTLEGHPEHKRRRIARETLEIFAPLANRLGIWQIKWELEDLSFRYLEPVTYRNLSRAMDQKRAERVSWMDETRETLAKALNEAGIRAVIDGRPKHIYGIYRKMRRKEVPFDQIYDLHGFRIIVDSVADCYATLGVVHSHWRPIPGEFDDYIASPKDNMYRSLHTAVVGSNGKPMEVQIRTHEMHQVAEFGIAAHWRYKEDRQANQYLDNKIAWIRQLMEWRQDVTDAQEFVSGMKTDVFQDRVYVFTPRGDVIDLPHSSTPIDFAYRVHTELGHRCRGAKVNGRLVPLDFQLHNGDQVEVISAKRGGPSRDWINPNMGYVATTRARGKIRTWFRKQAREENIAQGRQILEKDLKRLSVDQPYELVARICGFEELDDFLAAIGYGDVTSQTIAQRVIEYERSQQSEEEEPEQLLEQTPHRPVSVDGVQVAGLDGVLAHPARCCNPVPGDPIAGYVTRGRGVSIHKTNCPNFATLIQRTDHARLVEVQWGAKSEEMYPVSIQVKAYDRAGLLRDVTGLVADEKINMRSAEAVTGMKNNMALINATLELSNISQLTRIMTRIERLPNVLEVRRLVG
ncbi:MAG: bifunctional (p)ppGpp synthetase/guanosine-3',5'-bis(diphosphate) 3'-pyrophosphohydrolase [Caldilineaceae bacterium]|nr:bifunctional (p)ppGpp synthetase/guanosine-3',5'-bis(diphosphate) 3'-pyrophosphohydrolase [Caldilineaceae bacterium]